MVIFIKGDIETLNYFIDDMAEGREDVLILDTTQPEAMLQKLEAHDRYIDDSTCVISFNNFGVGINTPDGYYWEQKQVKIYNIYVDHPVNFLPSIEGAYKNLKFLLIDMYHCEFVKANFPAVAERVFFLPHGGKDLGLFKNAQRDIDILYTGSCQSNDIQYPAIDFLDGQEAEMYEFCYQVFRNQPDFQVDNVVDVYIYHSGLQFTLEQRMHLISRVSMTVERQVMHDLKYMFFSALAEAGMHIQIYGNGWEELQQCFPDKITAGSMLKSEECIQEMGRAKIVLNMQPFFTYGGHERVFNSMLNGAVCVSNPSKYLEARFEHNKNILFIDFDNLNKTVGEIKRVLEDQDLFERMRTSAYEIVQHDTWKHRLQQILTGNVEQNI